MSLKPIYLPSDPTQAYYPVPLTESEERVTSAFRTQVATQPLFQRNPVGVNEQNPQAPQALSGASQYLPMGIPRYLFSSFPAPSSPLATPAAKRPADSDWSHQPLKMPAIGSIGRETASERSNPLFRQSLENAMRFFNAKNYKEAIDAIRLSFKNYQKAGFAIYLLSSINRDLSADVRNDALNYAYHLLAASPCNPNGLLLLGLCQIEPGKYREAERIFKSSTRLYSDPLSRILLDEVTRQANRKIYSATTPDAASITPQPIPRLAKMQIDFLIN